MLLRVSVGYPTGLYKERASEIWRQEGILSFYLTAWNGMYVLLGGYLSPRDSTKRPAKYLMENVF